MNKKIQKILALVLTLSMVLSVFTVSMFVSAENDQIWNGQIADSAPTDTDGDGWIEINNGADLAYVVKNGGGEGNKYILTTDIYLNDVDKVKGITSGAPYVVDKFEQDRQKIENDILTMLGVNNVGIGEKKEHLIVDEVNANNEDIEQQSISFRTEIEDFFDRVYKVFGYKVDVYDMNEMFKEAEDEVDEKEEDNNDASNY